MMAAAAPPLSATPAVLSVAATRPGPALGFMGATLGMSLADWKALPFPDRTPGVVSTVCTDNAPAARAAGLRLSAADRRNATLLCTYVTGAAQGLSLRQPVALDQGYLARQVVYAFRGGRLASIRYHTSIDAFDNVVARLRAEAGDPSVIRRDQVRSRFGEALDRVRMDWRTPRATVELTDPAGSSDQLTVAMTAASKASTPP